METQCVLLNAVREQVGQIDKEIPVNRPITMEEIVGQEVKQPRFNMALFTFFGGLGLALAAIGIFGVLSYSVARRTHEIGVRMALGADRSHVLGLMMAMGGKLVLTGLAVGLAGSLLLGRYLQSEVFSVPVTDPVDDCGCGDAAGSDGVCGMSGAGAARDTAGADVCPAPRLRNLATQQRQSA